MLKELDLENYRNYRHLQLKFGAKPGLVYFVGDNGQGKTNILEAIYLLALTKSFRTSKVDNLIKWGEEFGRVRGSFSYDEISKVSLEVFLGKPPNPGRVLKKNEVKINAQDFLGSAQIVFFHPEDINMLYLGPELRRRYLDLMMVQVNMGYFMALRNFKRIKEHRNAILKGIKDSRYSVGDLRVWDNRFAIEAEKIYMERAKTIGFVNNRINAIYQGISEGQEKVELVYKNSLDLNDQMILESLNLKEVIMEELEKSLSRDIASEHTSIGPHRDDFEVLLNGKNIQYHASRGEFRSIVLTLKLIEISYFQEISPDGKPVLLLDDVFSELDQNRQHRMLDQVKSFQTFVTTTKDAAVISRERLRDGEFIEIAGGKLI